MANAFFVNCLKFILSSQRYFEVSNVIKTNPRQLKITPLERFVFFHFLFPFVWTSEHIIRRLKIWRNWTLIRNTDNLKNWNSVLLPAIQGRLLWLDTGFLRPRAPGGAIATSNNRHPQTLSSSSLAQWRAKTTNKVGSNYPIILVDVNCQYCWQVGNSQNHSLSQWRNSVKAASLLCPCQLLATTHGRSGATAQCHLRQVIMSVVFVGRLVPSTVISQRLVW